MNSSFQDRERFSVLVVDDDQNVTKMIRLNLQDKDIQVVEAGTGLECIRILQEERIDLILLDLGLPDFNGWGILSLLRLTEPFSRIPVIVLSAEPPTLPPVKPLRADDYIQKPFGMPDLVARVRKVIDSRSAN